MDEVRAAAAAELDEVRATAVGAQKKLMVDECVEAVLALESAEVADFQAALMKKLLKPSFAPATARGTQTLPLGTTGTLPKRLWRPPRARHGVRRPRVSNLGTARMKERSEPPRWRLFSI